MVKLATWFSDAHRVGFSALTLSVLPCLLYAHQTGNSKGEQETGKKQAFSE